MQGLLTSEEYCATVARLNVVVQEVKAEASGAMLWLLCLCCGICCLFAKLKALGDRTRVKVNAILEEENKKLEASGRALRYVLEPGARYVYLNLTQEEAAINAAYRARMAPAAAGAGVGAGAGGLLMAPAAPVAAPAGVAPGTVPVATAVPVGAPAFVPGAVPVAVGAPADPSLPPTMAATGAPQPAAAATGVGAAVPYQATPVVPYPSAGAAVPYPSGGAAAAVPYVPSSNNGKGGAPLLL